MVLKSIQIKNFTVFKEEDIKLSSGINVIVGANGMGKTHLLKLLYSASQAVDPKISFPQKIVTCFLPDDYRIARLVRRQQGANHANVKVTAGTHGLPDGDKSISLSFNSKTTKWDADVKGESSWEEQLPEMSSIFIPAKEILSNAYNLSAAVEKNNVSFDDTYIDIINSSKIDISVGKNSKAKDKRLKEIEKIIGGKVTYDAKKDEFYLRQGNKNLEFPLVAEGIRKVALLWQLVKNGTLETGSILLWDEPEANLNPMYVPVIIQLLLELARSGVQIFVSTHDYFIAKYLDVKKEDKDMVRFLSLYKTEEGVKCEAENSFSLLNHNSIMDTFIALYEEEITESKTQKG